jgi:hypothetical protein
MNTFFAGGMIMRHHGILAHLHAAADGVLIVIRPPTRLPSLDQALHCCLLRQGEHQHIVGGLDLCAEVGSDQQGNGMCLTRMAKGYDGSHRQKTSDCTLVTVTATALNSSM